MFTIRQNTVPCLIKQVLDKTWWSHFTGGLLVVQGNCTPNLDKNSTNFYSSGTAFIHVLSFHYSKFQFAIQPTSNRNNTSFFFWGWTTKSPRKPYTKFGPDIQRTCHVIRSLLFDTPRAMSYKASFRPNVVVPIHRWTTCGSKQLHTKFGQNTGTTSIHFYSIDKSWELYSREGDNSNRFEGKTMPWEHTIRI